MRVIIASPSLVERSRLARTLSGRSDVTLLGQPADLSQTYTICEAEEPDIVLWAVPLWNAMSSAACARSSMRSGRIGS